ncbi:MAG TPA: DedA family protein [Xanthobacteraceae bacterium]|nr:DedA family protein [Xanthobacteraceae bacterium]
MHAVAHLVHAYGLLVVAGFIGLESIGIPLPGETALIVGSVIAGRTHELNIIAVMLIAVAASLIGRMIGYLIGAQFGYWLLLRFGSYVRITESRIKLGQYLFLEHGSPIIIIAQFIPVLRSIVGILAGANRMPWRHFLIASAIGAGLWSAFFGVAAYSFGRQFAHLAAHLWLFSGPSGWCIFGVAAAIIVIVFAIFVGRHEAQLAAKAERALPGPLQVP